MVKWREGAIEFDTDEPLAQTLSNCVTLTSRSTTLRPVSSSIKLR